MKLFSPDMYDKIGLLITMLFVLLMFIFFEIKNWWEDRKINKLKMGRLERMKEITKAHPYFGKGEVLKMCITDEIPNELYSAKAWNETYQKLIVDLKKDVKNLNDRIQQLIEFDKIKNRSFDYALTVIQDLLNNSDEYARQRAIDFLKGVKNDDNN